MVVLYAFRDGEDHESEEGSIIALEGRKVCVLKQSEIHTAAAGAQFLLNQLQFTLTAEAAAAALLLQLL